MGDQGKEARFKEFRVFLSFLRVQLHEFQKEWPILIAISILCSLIPYVYVVNMSSWQEQVAEAHAEVINDIRGKFQQFRGGPSVFEGIKAFCAAVNWSVRVYMNTGAFFLRGTEMHVVLSISPSTDNLPTAHNNI